MLRAVLPFVLGVLVVLASLSPAHAQVSDSDVGTNAALLSLFPELRSAKAPAVVRSGLRVSYASGAAVAGGGGAGGGVIQYDVVASDADQVIAVQANYGDVGMGLTLLGTGVARGYPGLGAFYIDPSVLADAESLGSDTLSVTRVEKQLDDGSPVTVVRFQTLTQNGTTATEFDTETGLMVFDGLSGGSTAAQLRLQSFRTVTLPWPTTRAPNWVRPDTKLVYRGARTVAVDGGTPVQTPISAQVVMEEAGSHYSLESQTQYINGQTPGPKPSATGAMQIMPGFWLPAAALGVTIPSSSELIDSDPITGAEVSWGPSSDGGIAVQLNMPGLRIASLYDRELGVLSQQATEQMDGISVTAYNLKLQIQESDDLQALAELPPLPDDPQTSTGGVMASGGAMASGGTMASGDGMEDAAVPGTVDASMEDSSSSGGGSSGGCQVARGADLLGSVGGVLLLALAHLARRRRRG